MKKPRRNSVASLKHTMHINLQTMIEEFRHALLLREKIIQDQRKEIQRLRLKLP